ncbi:MAG: DUF4251 domain-containing protein [Mangrovibacterium sp.]
MKQILLAIVLVLGGMSVQAQKLSRKEREAIQSQEVKAQLDSGVFTFEARSAQPMSGRQIELTSEYTLSLNGDSIEVYLPYFGRAYSAPYGGQGGIEFKTLMVSNKKIYKEKKSCYQYDIEVATSDDRYSLQLTVGLSGFANLSVRSNNRQSIGFQGTILLEETTEDVSK